MTSNPVISLSRLSIAISILFITLLAAIEVQSAETLDFYFIDTEGGKSTLIVSPSGESLLIDAGFPGDRDADRIASAAKLAGVMKIDYLLITHYHIDHVGGVRDLLKRLPVHSFFDHGPSIEPRGPMIEVYDKATATGTHKVLAPGDTIAMSGVDIRVVTSAGKFIGGKGEANPFCEN